MRDLTHAPAKKNVLIHDATHFVLFEKHRADSSKNTAPSFTRRFWIS
jgi:hypothetical protein